MAESVLHDGGAWQAPRRASRQHSLTESLLLRAPQQVYTRPRTAAGQITATGSPRPAEASHVPRCASAQPSGPRVWSSAVRPGIRGQGPGGSPRVSPHRGPLVPPPQPPLLPTVQRPVSAAGPAAGGVLRTKIRAPDRVTAAPGVLCITGSPEHKSPTHKRRQLARALQQRPCSAGLGPADRPGGGIGQPQIGALLAAELRAATKVDTQRVRSDSPRPALPQDNESDLSMEGRDPVSLGLADDWCGRWPVSRGFESLVRGIDKVLPRMEEEGLGEKWRALGEWVGMYMNNRHAEQIAKRCEHLVKKDRPEENADGPRQGLGLKHMKQAAKVLGIAQRLNISQRRKEIASTMVALDQLLVFASRCHPCLWNTARTVRHSVLTLLYSGLKDKGKTMDLCGTEEDWSEEPATCAPVPRWYCFDDEETVRKAVTSYARRKSWHEIATDMKKRLGILSEDMSLEQQMAEKLMLVMDRAVKFWQGVVQRVLLRAWRALRRAEQQRQSEATGHKSEGDELRRTLQCRIEMAAEQARHEATMECNEIHRRRMDEIHSQLAKAESRARVNQDARDAMHTMVESQEKRIADLTEQLQEAHEQLDAQKVELADFRKLCKDFIVESLEGPTWVVVQQEQLSSIVGDGSLDDSFGGAAGLITSPRAAGQARRRGSHRMSVCRTPTEVLGQSGHGVAPSPVAVPLLQAPDSAGAEADTPNPPPLSVGGSAEEEPPITVSPPAPEVKCTPLAAEVIQVTTCPTPPECAVSGDSPWAAPVAHREAQKDFAVDRSEEPFLLEFFNKAIQLSGHPQAQRYALKSFATGFRLFNAYALVMHFMSPGAVPKDMVERILSTDRDIDKAELVLQAAECVDMVFPLTAEELCNPGARAQHLLVATALLQRFSDHHLSVACGMRPLQGPKDPQDGPVSNPLWPAGGDPVTAAEWRERMDRAFQRSLKWRGAGAGAQSLATEVLLSKVQGRADRGQTVGEEAQRRQYVTDPVEKASVFEQYLDTPPKSEERTAEMQEIEATLAHNFRALRRIYLFYSTGDHLDVQLDFDEMYKLLTESRLAGKHGGFSRPLIEDVHRRSGSTGRNTLDPTEYVHSLLILAGEMRKNWPRKYIQQAPFKDRFRILVEEYMGTYANYVDLADFRNVLHGAGCRKVFDLHGELLLATFRSFATAGRSSESRMMTIKDFQELVGAMQIIDSILSYDSVRTIFLKMQDVDTDAEGGLVQIGPGSAEHVAAYTEYIECIGALAMYKVPAPYLPMCRRLQRFLELYFVPAFDRNQKVRFELGRMRAAKTGGLGVGASPMKSTGSPSVTGKQAFFTDRGGTPRS
eukprot:TRINITY_DN13326_c0_g1_i2.p1 TRINITY_DN13326_c0_g1~~TRINITY_DN13326_c0_g1_i2.p1  ORF type:complete len:1321 (+),score=437.12 TRINITY_DN13326_c0_g1_i2:63-4025(+)